MWKDRTVILNEEKKIVFIGKKVLEYIDRSGTLPLAYPEGRAEKGDLMVCYSKKATDFKEVLAALNLALPASVKKVENSKGFLLVWELYNEAVSPVVKVIKQENLEEQILLDTIYGGKEIQAAFNGGALIVTVDGQTVEWSLAEVETCGLLIDGYGVKYYDCDAVAQALGAEGFPARMDFSKIYGKTLEGVLQPAAVECVNALTEDLSRGVFTSRGKLVQVRYEGVDFVGGAAHLYQFEDTADLHCTLTERSAEYAELVNDTERDHIRKQKVTTFRLFGTHERMGGTERLLQKGSVTNTTILLTGESGTGKTFLAQQIHRNSKRHDGPFVHVNCAAIPYQLIESELFGYEDGAFTGARKGGKRGYFEMAAGGTLFLDEITEIPISLQGKLLEVLQNKTFYRVGGTKKLETNLRVIAATNRDLKKEIAEKRFREDLYYRIHVFPVEIPPLRARAESIYEIICDILPEICNRLEIEPLIVSSQALEKMEHYSWPGNIRELENVLEKAAILSDGKVILPGDVILEGECWDDGHGTSNLELDANAEGPVLTMKEWKERCEEEAIRDALLRCGGDKERAAKELDIGRSNLFEKIKKYQIDVKEQK